MKKSKLINTLSRIAALIFLLLFFSCSKSFVKTRQISDLNSLQNRVDKRCQLLSSNSFKIKFKAIAKLDDKQNKLVGKLYVYSDTSLYISVLSYTLGVEIAQFYFNSDSVYFANKIQKELLCGTYEEINSSLNFNLIYSALTASYYNVSKKGITDNNCHYIADFQKFIVNDLYKFNANNGFFLTTNFNSNGNIEKIDYKSYDGNFLRINYSNFAGEYGFPESVSIVTSFMNENIEMNMNIENVDIISKKYFVHSKPSFDNYKRLNVKNVEN